MIFFSSIHASAGSVPARVLALLLAFVSASRGFGETPRNETARNTALDVQYVGRDACRECHREAHQSYLQTKHSISMEEVNPANEVAPASFRHPASGNDYEVEQRDDRLFHRERIRGVDGEILATTEREIVYTIGSGTHGKSYVYRDGRFFGQSPISWYEDSQRWSMSPGYDLPFHPGFGRKLSSECFFCHVGAVDHKAGNPNDFTITELTIGCERCHGPGQLHVEKHRGKAVASGRDQTSGRDDTIVNPASLPRALSEAVCQQCHLQAAGKALVSEKDEWDFRPGLPLTDVRIDYQYRLGDDSMRVVGHVEQLHMSECYRQTDNLTCITCHDPHHAPPPAQRVDHFRSICLKCHDHDACGEPLSRRQAIANNDCAQCHMPKKDTEVPHTALSHHRIGIHGGEPNEEEIAVGLAAVLDTSALKPMERDRSEAIAKFQVAQEQPGNPNFRDFPIESAKTLIQVKNAGQADAEANTVLAMLARSQGQPDIARDLASEVVNTEPQPSRAKIEALRLLAQLAYQRRDYETAAQTYRELTQYQSEPHDFFHLGISEQNRGDSQKAVAALSKAIELAPTYVEAHRVLSAIQSRLGRREEAQRHADLADQHQARMQSLWQATANPQ